MPAPKECPIRSIVNMTSCTKEDCEWWDKKAKSCIIKVIANEHKD